MEKKPGQSINHTFDTDVLVAEQLWRLKVAAYIRAFLSPQGAHLTTYVTMLMLAATHL